MGTRLSIVGERYGMLIVKEYAGLDSSGNSRWLCKCDCGNTKIISAKNLRRPDIGTKSCGCLVNIKQKQFQDLTGMRFGRLVVIGFDHMGKGGHTFWKCECDCGNITICQRSHLLHGDTISCGCYRSEKNKIKPRKQINTNYGIFYLSDRIVKIYIGMINRCFCETTYSYKYYSKKNITISKKWYDTKNINSKIDYDGLVRFINDMYPSYCEHVKLYGEANTTIDRIDYNKNYSKKNCRWATYEVQNNNMSSNRHIYDGEEILTFSECVKKYIPSGLLKGAYKNKPGGIITTKITNGWTVDEILGFLRIAKRRGKLLKRKHIQKFIILHTNQRCVYDKYPKEKRLPGYEHI